MGSQGRALSVVVWGGGGRQGGTLGEHKSAMGDYLVNGKGQERMRPDRKEGKCLGNIRESQMLIFGAGERSPEVLGTGWEAFSPVRRTGAPPRYNHWGLSDRMSPVFTIHLAASEIGGKGLYPF